MTATKERLWISGFGATTADIARAICPALGAHAEAGAVEVLPWGKLTKVENPVVFHAENDRFFHGGFGKHWSHSFSGG